MRTGKDIIDLGFKPSKWFKDVIDYANQNQLSGDSLDRKSTRLNSSHLG
jgi:hypothetical protein